MDNNKFNETWNDPRAFIFGNQHFGGYCNPRMFQFALHGDLSPEEFEKKFEEKAREFHKLGKEFKKTHFDPCFEDRETKKERLQPLSIRVKPHTKKFLKEESKLSPREILEIYENYTNNSEDYINSLKEEEKELEKELNQIKEKIKNTKQFMEKLDE